MSALDQSQHKTELRKRLRRLRASLTPAQKRDGATRAARMALRLPALRRARHVACYFSYGSEISTAPLLKQLLALGKQVYVPRLRGQAMHFMPIDATTALRKNRFGIREPVGKKQRSAQRMDVILLPLTGFDADGNRLGTGGGYYDRTLAAALRPFRRPLRVGYAYNIQQSSSPLPHDPWDVGLDAVVTDKGIQQWRKPSITG